MGFKRWLAGTLGAGILVSGLSSGGPTAALAHQPAAAPVIRQEGQGTYENMVAALGNLGAEIDQLSTMTDLTLSNVRIFDADYLATGQDPAVLDEAVALHGAEIQQVQSALAANEIVREVLETVQIPVESVVAVDVLSGGDVAIYYQP